MIDKKLLPTLIVAGISVYLITGWLGRFAKRMEGVAPLARGRI